MVPGCGDETSEIEIIHPLRLAQETCTSAEAAETADSIKAFAMQSLVALAHELYIYLCPICFDEIKKDEAVATLPCGHLVCMDCFHSYVKLKVRDIRRFRQNPFICPIDTCRMQLSIDGFITHFLASEEVEAVNLWDTDSNFPRCSSLDRCLSPACCAASAKGGTVAGVMRRVETKSFQVFCDFCQKTWCELCLKRIDSIGRTANFAFHAESFDHKKVIKFCRRYVRASPTMKDKCRTKYPWIDGYIVSLFGDVNAAKMWVLEFGQLCPSCGLGVERTEGCFHMQCVECATHFCYECGGELNYPYYGVHHCWEKEE